MGPIVSCVCVDSIFEFVGVVRALSSSCVENECVGGEFIYESHAWCWQTKWFSNVEKKWAGVF